MGATPEMLRQAARRLLARAENAQAAGNAMDAGINKVRAEALFAQADDMQRCRKP